MVKDVEKYVEILSQEIKRRDGSVFELDSRAFDFDQAVRCFVTRLSIRGKTLNEKRVCINKTNYIDNSLVVKYYSNSLNYLFVQEALVFFIL